jgi:hypothetical protein
MKKVHKSEMVAHLWANQSQSEARNTRGSIYFRGGTLYSYRDDFPISRHVETKRGRAVLHTLDTYSSTTAKHCHYARMATNHMACFHVYDLEAKPGKQFKGYASRLKGMIEDYAKARGRRPAILAVMQSLVDEANIFAKFFGMKSRLFMPSNLDELVTECQAIAKRAAKQAKFAAEKRKVAEQEKLHKAERWLDDWVMGYDIIQGLEPFYKLPIRLRIVGDTLETSAGAEVPLEHAIRAFKIIRKLYWQGRKGFPAEPIRVGHFQIDKVDTDGIKAGCHRIEWAEIDRVAVLAGVA